MTEAEMIRGLQELQEKFSRDVQVYLWSRNQERSDLIRVVLKRLQDPERA